MAEWSNFADFTTWTTEIDDNEIDNDETEIKEHEASIVVTGTTNKKKGRSNFNKNHNCVPLMISHLLESGKTLKLWGMPVKTFTIVGIIRSIETATTKITFDVEDETGSIKALQMIEEESVTYKPPIKLNTYAKISGSLRIQNGNKFIVILSIRPLEHLNELLTHLVEVTYVTLQSEKSKASTTESSESMFFNLSIGSEVEKNSNKLPAHQSDVLKVFKTLNEID